MIKVVFRSHRQALRAGTADPQKLFAMLKLIPQEDVAQARPSLSACLVIDTSGSMREFADQAAAQQEIQRRGLVGTPNQVDGQAGQGYDLNAPTKMDRAIEAAHRLIDDARLLTTDRVALVHFDDEARLLLPLTPLANRQIAHDAVESLRDHSGGTQMGMGLGVALDALSDVPSQAATRIFLLTDGRAFDEQECRSAAGELAEANIPITAFGIGTEYNEGLLRDVAATTQGRPYHLQDMEQLNSYLDDEIGAVIREVITDLQSSVSTVKGVALESITRVYPNLSEVGMEASKGLLGNIAAGDFTVFIFEFTVSGIARPASKARVAQVGLTGQVPALDRRDELEVQELSVIFTEDEAAAAEVDAEVLGYVQQKNVDRMVQDAVGLATVDVGRAKQTLQVAAGMTKRLGNSAVTKMLENALSELDATGAISAETRKTVSLGGRTRTVMTGGTKQADDLPSDDEIRKLTGV